MTNLNQFEAWFVTGTQHLYGEETLRIRWALSEWGRCKTDFLTRLHAERINVFVVDLGNRELRWYDKSYQYSNK